MKIKDKALIKYFGRRNINENSIKSKLIIDSNFDMQELISIMNAFPRRIQDIVIKSTDASFISNVVLNLPDDVNIELKSVSKNTFDELTLKEGCRINKISFNSKDKNNETINIGHIIFKFPKAVIDYPFQLVPNINVTELEDVTALLKKSGIADLNQELLEYYRDYIQNNPQSIDIKIGNGTVYDNTSMMKWNNINSNAKCYTACELQEVNDYSKYIEEAKNSSIVILINNMSDVSLKLAIKLKTVGLDCTIRMHSCNNNSCQNENYSLDEYIQMAIVMDELIGDIDDNLPEQEKFGKIYQRITSYLVYDYPAAYPKNKEERKYSEKNSRNCRNLRNGLLEGKAVCAGYADILKNACLIKGIECEYIQGPVDELCSKGAFLYSKYVKDNNKELMYMDDDHVITREYHAWNKVKINGVWYNCDPTWDSKEIIDGRRPKYAMLSDDTYKKLGRPTCEVLRHPCTVDMESAEKAEIFRGLEPAGNLVSYNKLIEFEKTVDEYGKPRQLPVPLNTMPWTKMMWKLRFFAITGQTKIRDGLKNIFSTIIDKVALQKDISNEDTEPLPVIDDKDTEPLPTIDDKDTEPLPTIDDKDTEPIPTIENDETEPIAVVSKKTSWELSKEELEAVKAVEKENLHIIEKDDENVNKNQEKELGE